MEISSHSKQDVVFDWFYCAKNSLSSAVMDLWGSLLSLMKSFLLNRPQRLLKLEWVVCMLRDHFVYVPSQWKTMLHCNIVSHWLGTCTKWFLHASGLAPTIIRCIYPNIGIPIKKKRWSSDHLIFVMAISKLLIWHSDIEIVFLHNRNSCTGEMVSYGKKCLVLQKITLICQILDIF